MTEPPRRDDEIVSAVLDGEATPEERARVDGDGNLARRLAEFRSVSDVVGDPVQTVDAATREANIAQALRSADDHGGRDDAEVIGLDRAERRWRPDLNRKVLVTVAAVVGFLALAGGLLTVGDGNEAQDQAGGTADRAEAPTGDLAVPDLDLGAVDDVETLRLRINEATGLDRQADDTEAFAAAENAEGAVGAPATDEGSPTSSTPADGADPSGALVVATESLYKGAVRPHWGAR